MNLRIVIFGKPNKGFVADEIAKYAKRFNGHAEFEILSLKESSKKNPIEKLEDEYQTYVKKIGLNEALCVMTEEAKTMTTIEMSSWLEKVSSQVSSPGRLNFLIGSAYGISDKLKDHARWKISLSKLTFTHDHALVLLVEQLYRCLMVQIKHPYHHV